MFRIRNSIKRTLKCRNITLIYAISLCAGIYIILRHSKTKILDQRETKIAFHKQKVYVQREKETELVAEKKDKHKIPKQTTVSEKETPTSLSANPAVNVHTISKITVIDTSLCVKTKTPSVFTMCTWELDKDRFVSGDIHSKGLWEPTETQMIYDLLNTERKVTFIDIGASMGYFSLLAASLGQPVVAVEPMVQNIEKFAKSIHINKFEDRITVLNNAVSNERRVVRIDAPRSFNQGAVRLVSENERQESTDNSFYITSITLNDLKNFISTKDIVIKMDIEGHECKAMEVSDEIFDKFNVIFITMEWGIMHEFRNKQGIACPPGHIQKMVEMLTKRGYTPYSLDKQLDAKEHKTWTNSDIYWKRKPV